MLSRSELPISELKNTSDGGLDLVWESIAGRSYQIRYRVGMTEELDWTDIGPVVTANWPAASVALEIDPRQPSRFFQVVDIE